MSTPMKDALDILGERLRGSLWFVPALCVACSVALSFATVEIDRRIGDADPWLLYGGDANRAADILSTIAASMLTFTALVFTITMVVLQLASAQFSPRVLRTYLRDRQSKLALGVFVATFVYSLFVLRTARSGLDGVDSGFVPALSMLIAFVLVLVSVALFIQYAHHIAQSIRVGNVIERITRETRDVIERRYPAERAEGVSDEVARPSGSPDSIVPARRAAVIVRINAEHLSKLADANDVRFVCVHPVGTYVPEGVPLVEIFGRAPELDEDEVGRAVALGGERSMEQDPAFGIRQLVDIASRALSPGVNDPTTAVHVVDRLHDLLRRLADRRLVPNGAVERVRLNEPTWSDLLALAIEEIRIYGCGSTQVCRRLRVMLDDLEQITHGGRRRSVIDQRSLLEATVESSFEQRRDRAAVAEGERQIPY